MTGLAETGGRNFFERQASRAANSEERSRMIRTENLSKRYARLTAVDDVSFEVGPGEVLGFLGPNGAGKTTTMRMLAGFITPTARQGQHLRPRRGDRAARRQGQPRLSARGRAQLRRDDAFGSSWISSPTCARSRARAARRASITSSGACSSSGVLEQTIETLSKGFRRRVGPGAGHRARPAGADPR